MTETRALVPEVSVVMPARNAAATIGEQLDALAAQIFDDGPWEVIVVDDGSTDGTAEIAAHWAEKLPSLTVLSSVESYGTSHARNTGTRAGTGLRIAYCDADDVVSPGWLSAIVGALDDHQLATGPIDLAMLNPPEMYRWRGTAGWKRLPDWRHFLPSATGGNLGVNRDLFCRLNGFDPTLKCGEDLDFVWRAQLDGARLGFAPDALLHHRLRTKPFAFFWAHFNYGMADVHLFTRFAAHGMPRRLWAGAARTALIIASCPLLVFRNQRYRWLAGAGTAVGRVVSSCQNGVLYL